MDVVIYYLGSTVGKMTFIMATFAEPAVFPRLSPKYHKVSHENNPICFWVSAPNPGLDPFQRLGEGESHSNSFTVLDTFFLQDLQLCHQYRNL